MTVTTYSNAMQMDVNPAGEVYSILRDNPIPLDISSVVVAPCQGTGPWQPLAFGCCCQVPVPLAAPPSWHLQLSFISCVPLVAA